MRNYCNFIPDSDDPTNTCCHQHDRDYGINGTVTRKEADERLRDCILKCGKSKVFAYAVYAAVRAFGWVFYKTKNG